MNQNKAKIIESELRAIQKARIEFMAKQTIDTASRNTELFKIYDSTEKYLLKHLIKYSFYC